MSDNLVDSLPEESIALDVHAADWREAITLSGDGLVSSGATSAEYTREMIEAVEELGPYIVIAPGLALAHARPSPAVLTGGLSWVRLAEPVEFGHATNDPVTLVIGLAAKDHDAHIGVMSALAGVLADPEQMRQLTEAPTPARVRELLTSFTEDQN